MIVFIFAVQIVFVLAQGAAVFSTAFLALRILGNSHPLAKVVAMGFSYLAWSGCTVAGYALSGGDGGLMDGFGLVLLLCFTALLSSVFYCLIWALAPYFTRPSNG